MAYVGYNEAKKKANKKYLEKMARIAFVVKPSEKAEIERRAKAAGKSVNSYLRDLALEGWHDPEENGG